MKKIVVHMIGNAHLDPVWLWTWHQGLDAALATCRTACDLLDEFPDFVVTRGEAWVHEQVRLIDPALFERIKKHVASGRWSIVNGWWVQSDCNLPTAESFRKHCSLGKAWFRRHLGVEVDVGYNVDSFGHAVTLPMFLKEAGYKGYVFMRPSPNEMELPADLFEWRAPDKSSITAARLTSYVVYSADQMKGAVERSLSRANKEVGHAMCFYGVGDHGGGPTRAQIEWITNHRHFSDEVELIFSSPSRFFEAVAASGKRLPVVKDELHYHAVGCYSVVHDIKQQMRRAEQLCVQAGHLMEAFPDCVPEEADAALEKAWQRVLFNQFHDILAGTSIEPACAHTLDELGAAKTTALEIITHISRKRALGTQPCRNQRLILFNVENKDFDGQHHVEFFGTQLSGGTHFVERNGKPIRSQPVQPLSATQVMSAFVIEARVPALSSKEIELRPGEAPAAPKRMKCSRTGMDNGLITIRLGERGIVSLRARGMNALGTGGISIAAFADDMDTWSHATPALDGKQVGVFKTNQPWQVIEQGQLRVGVANSFHMGKSSLLWQLYLESKSRMLRMRLRINWNDRHKVLKLLLPPSFTPSSRIDLVPGGRIRRAQNGREYPFHNASVLKGKASIAAISADVYGLDVQPRGLMRMTLLRCTPYAHHIPYKLEPNNTFAYTDQGEHVFDISLLPGRASLSWTDIEKEICRQTQPIIAVDTTDGMR